MPVPQLLIELEPRSRVFLRNLVDLVFLRPAPYVPTTSRPASFWPDVFVDTRISRRSLAQSALWHVLAVVSIYGITTAWTSQLTQTEIFHNAQITYYNVSDYLPPVDSGSQPAEHARAADPVWAKQQVISLPKNADNSRQTIIDPSTVKVLPAPKPMPNIVAWAAPTPVVPTAGLEHSRISIPTPDLSVIAPPVQPGARNLAQLRGVATAAAIAPAAEVGAHDLSRLNLPKVPSQGAVEPIASIDVQRKLGDLNVASYSPTIAEPKLPVEPQRSSGAGGAGTSGGAQQQATVPASPAVGGASVREAAGKLIALGLDPVTPRGPIEMPGGNRRGAFAAGPEGKPGASGTPASAAGGTATAGGSNPGGGPADIPAGIYVPGKLPATLGAVVAAGAPVAPAPPPPPAAATRAALPRMLPSLPNRVTEIARQTTPGATPPAPTKLEERVFGPKRTYTMSLNMPNLTSGSGTWIIHFAELHDSPDKTEVTAPVATSKVDPAYPQDLMRDNVEGTVTLYAVIHADGSVGEVRVLQGIDSRLDDNACVALSRWHFQPGTKHGEAIDVEAVVQIPFRLKRITY